MKPILWTDKPPSSNFHPILVGLTRSKILQMHFGPDSDLDMEVRFEIDLDEAISSNMLSSSDFSLILIEQSPSKILEMH